MKPGVRKKISWLKKEQWETEGQVCMIKYNKYFWKRKSLKTNTLLPLFFFYAFKTWRACRAIPNVPEQVLLRPEARVVVLGILVRHSWRVCLGTLQTPRCPSPAPSSRVLYFLFIFLVSSKTMGQGISLHVTGRGIRGQARWSRAGGLWVPLLDLQASSYIHFSPAGIKIHNWIYLLDFSSVR